MRMADRRLASIRIRLHHGDTFAMGPGKADLLEAIQATRSIAAAGRQLGLSYWKTRRLLEVMNQCFRLPVVDTSRGGDGGGGSRVTETGLQALAQFRAMETLARAVIENQIELFQDLLKDGERAPTGQGDV